MAEGKLQRVLRQLHRAADAPDRGDPPDRQLLERFAASRDEGAFAALVTRHGPLVWGVCWRALRHAQDTEDCFQATFLVLARKAGLVRWHESAANWLYSVASRVAAEARARRARRRTREREVVAVPEGKAENQSAARELCAALDTELQALPEKYRAPLLVCYLEGRTADHAARQLGLSLRTLERRLAEGRERLRARLTRRGLTLSGVLLAVTLSGGAARATLPAGLAPATVTLATSLAGRLPAAVAALAETVSGGMATAKAKLATGAVLVLTATLGAGVLLGTTPACGPGADPAGAAAAMGPAAPRSGPGLPAGGNAGSRPADAPPRADERLARRAWAVLEVVEKNHVEPPPRRELVLAVAQSLHRAAGVTPPMDIAIRAAAVTNERQLAAFLRDIWPADGRDRPAGSLEAAALDGLLASIPGRPSLWKASDVERLHARGGNRYVGVGAQLATDDAERRPKIAVPFRGGPAHRAGVNPGDLLLEVDGRSTEGVTDPTKLVEWLRGEEGTAVTVVVRTPGAAGPRTLTLTRAAVPFDTVFGFRRTFGEGWDYLADPEACIAYVWVKALSAGTVDELRQLERRLRADGARALVLDLRFSSGEGHLDHAASVAGGLLEGGLMWAVAGKDGREYRADGECLFRGWPLVALVGGTDENAQGAVLAALQDNGRATLVGEPTRTDGTVRTFYHLPGDEHAVPVLTGRLERAAGTRGWPVKPDHEVGLTGQRRGGVQRWLLDKQLPHLPPGASDRPPQDPQLEAALALLREAVKRDPPPGEPGPAAAGPAAKWEVRGTFKVKKLNGPSGVFTPDGKLLAALGSERGVSLWDVAGGRESVRLGGHEGGPVAVSSDGKTLAVVLTRGPETLVGLTDTVTGKPMRLLEAEAACAALSPDGKTLATAQWRSVKLWDVATGKELAAFDGHRCQVKAVAFSPDGKALAVGTGHDFPVRDRVNGEVKVWDLGTKEARVSLDRRGSRAAVRAVAFSPDGRTLAWGGTDDVVTLWEVAAGKERAAVKVPGRVTVLAFGPGGAALAVGHAGDPRGLLLYDTVAGRSQTLATEMVVEAAAFAPDGKGVATLEEGGAVKWWVPAPEKAPAGGGDANPKRMP